MAFFFVVLLACVHIPPAVLLECIMHDPTINFAHLPGQRLPGTRTVCNPACVDKMSLAVLGGNSRHRIASENTYWR